MKTFKRWLFGVPVLGAVLAIGYLLLKNYVFSGLSDRSAAKAAMEAMDDRGRQSREKQKRHRQKAESHEKRAAKAREELDKRVETMRDGGNDAEANRADRWNRMVERRRRGVQPPSDSS